MIRIYVQIDMNVGSELDLPVGVIHRIRSVLRLPPDERVMLFNGNGSEYVARLVSVSHRAARAVITEERRRSTESSLDITLIQSLSRGHRMDYTIQKAVELGVRRVVPVVSKRTTVRLAGARADKRVEHWRGVALHATEQSGRVLVPEISTILPLEESFDKSAKGRLVLLNPHAETAFAVQPKPAPGLTIIAGPEGGFEVSEIEMLKAAGAISVHLGPRTLRTETAAVTALSIAQTLWGDFGREPQAN
jgi:16S rRNA (uracil1498-N3)-methyltransferase